MPIPDYQSVMLPLLNVAADGKEHHIRDAINTLADQFKLTEAEGVAPQWRGSHLRQQNRLGSHVPEESGTNRIP